MLSGILFFNLVYLFIYFCLHWIFVAVRKLSLVAVNRGHSLAAVHELTAVTSLVSEHGLWAHRLQLQHVGSITAAPRL